MQPAQRRTSGVFGGATGAVALAFTLLAAPRTQAQEVRVNEFLAANVSVRADENNEFSDWIELYNAGPGAADLTGWYLTDDALVLDKWRFPAVSIAEGGYLLVFASGKDRAVAGAELHTSFKLDSDGDFLALVRPDGATVAHEFSPEFPRQRANVSYGIATDAVTLVDSATAIDALVPGDGTLGLAWTDPAFAPDARWVRGAPGAPGFETAGAEPVLPAPLGAWELDGDTADETGRNDGVFGGTAPTYTNGHDGTPLSALQLDGADDYVAIPTGNGLPVFNRQAYTIAMWVKGMPQADKRVFSEGSTGSNTPLFTIGTHNLGTAGSVDIYVRTDGGATPLNHKNSAAIAFDGAWHHIAWVDANGQAALYVDGVRDPADFTYTKAALTLNKTAIGCVSRATVGYWFNGCIDRVGIWETALTAEEVAYLAGGGAPGTGAYDTLIGTDLDTAMHGVNASAYLRWPFTVPPSSTFESLALALRYDDGFVAYLNGVEVARRNAPATLAWNSAAPLVRSQSDSLKEETINITASLGALRAGLNVLAIHGLNAAADDADFLVAPRLQAATGGYGYGYFPTPSPGAANSDAVPGFVADTAFSARRGFYDAPFTVEISTSTPGAAIRYTTDASTPTPAYGTLYAGPIAIAKTTTLRAIAYKAGLLPTNVDTQTYVFPRDVLTQTGAGFPTNWGDHPLVYAVYPEVATNPLYEGTLENDLRSIPVLSIVLPVADVFGSGGLYPNATQRWERAASAELFYPDGRTGFQVNCGVSMHGGSSRNWTSTPKHSFRLYFRGTLGPSQLKYPLYGPEGAHEFQTLVIRACYTDTFCSRYNEPRYRPDKAQFIRDQWMRDAQLATGNLSARGIEVSLYVDGLYWGLYNIAEHPDAEFCASYLGGEEEDYDVVKDVELMDGNLTAWNQMFAIANAGVASDAAYRQLQEYLDIDSLIDYIILHLYAGTEDWPHHNWSSGRRRAPGEGYRFFSWDQEIVLDLLDRDYSEKDFDPSPARLHQRLRANAEYRLRFADHVQRHLFDDGTFTPESAEALYRRRTTEIDRAVVGESLKWAGYRAALQSPPIPAYTRDNEWMTWLTWTCDQYFPARTAVVLNQFRADSLYPATKAPVLSPHGGRVAPGFQLTIANPNGAGRVFYSLDGADVRVPLSGAVAPGAQEYTGPVTIARSALVRARVLDAASVWSACTEAHFRVTRPEDALRITEIMYHPAPGTAPNADAYEFIELENTGAAPIDMSGVAVGNAVEYVFPEGAVIEPGSFMVLVADPGAFAARYPHVRIDGVYSRSLANDTDTLTLTAVDGELLASVAYWDAWPWPAEADGAGRSLVPVDATAATAFNDPTFWRASVALGGSPGRDDVALPGGAQRPGDFNQDAKVDIADTIALLGYLFGGKADTLPCEGGTSPGEGNLALLDFNGDARLDISDAVAGLRFMFAGGAPHPLGGDCVLVTGCPEACTR